MPDSEECILDQNDVLGNIFRAKTLRRKELSKLPFKQKIEILLKLQKMAQGVKSPRGEKGRKIWVI
jgi:hypothetical protein